MKCSLGVLYVTLAVTLSLAISVETTLLTNRQGCSQMADAQFQLTGSLGDTVQCLVIVFPCLVIRPWPPVQFPSKLSIRVHLHRLLSVSSFNSLVSFRCTYSCVCFCRHVLMSWHGVRRRMHFLYQALRGKEVYAELCGGLVLPSCKDC